MNTFMTEKTEIIESMLSGERFKYISTPLDNSDSTQLVFESSRHAGMNDVLLVKHDGALVGVFADDNQTTHSVTDLTDALREHIRQMSRKDLKDFGHDPINGADQMLAALHTIDLLAAHDEGEARVACFDFLDTNLPGLGS